MSDKVQDLMKKHPPWFMFDFHPIRFAKKIWEEERGNEEETKVENS